MARRPHANPTEERFAQLAEQHGWTTSKRGWPDFLCWGPAGEIIAVEVKPRTTRGHHKLLKREQAACLDALTTLGVRCYVSDGDTLEKYTRATHAPEHRRRHPQQHTLDAPARRRVHAQR